MNSTPKFEVIGPKRSGLGPSMIHHTAAALCAFVFGALAFGLPADKVNALLKSPAPLDNVLHTALPLPVESDTLVSSDLLENADWQSTTVKPGDDINRIFSRLGLESGDFSSLISACDEAKELKKVLPGQVFQIRTDGDGDLVEIVRKTPRSDTRIFREGKIFKTAKFQHQIEKRRAFRAGIIKKSFYNSLKDNDLSDKVIRQIIDLFAGKINFSKDVQPGASFAVIFEEDYFSGEKIGDGNVLTIEFFDGARAHQLIGYRSDKENIRYYTPEGESLKQLFLRYPVNYKRISGHFDPDRRHPVLRKKRPHWGIDFAAPHGTPVRASADGSVKTINRQRGFGKIIILKHSNDYTSSYAHLSRFRKGLSTGEKVKKGDVIGYVGQTGLATGPHLHYELRIDNIPRDPLKTKLPTANPLPKNHLTKFRKHSQQLLTQLDIQQRIQLALKD